MFDQYSESATQDAIAVAQYLEAFPTNVDPISLGWDQMNQVGKFSVNFQYKRWIDGRQKATDDSPSH